MKFGALPKHCAFNSRPLHPGCLYACDNCDLVKKCMDDAGITELRKKRIREEWDAYDADYTMNMHTEEQSELTQAQLTRLKKTLAGIKGKMGRKEYFKSKSVRGGQR